MFSGRPGGIIYLQFPEKYISLEDTRSLKEVLEPKARVLLCRMSAWWRCIQNGETGKGFWIVCVHIHMCVCSCVHMRVETSHPLQAFSSETRSLFEPGPHLFWLGWLSSQPQGSSCLHLPSIGIIGTHCQAQLFI